MREIPLDNSVTATANAQGIATAEIGPVVYGHKWRVARMVTTTTDTILKNEARVYLNAVNSGRLIAGSYNGNEDFDNDAFTLQTLDKLKVVWSLVTPGSFCTLQVIGIIEDARG